MKRHLSSAVYIYAIRDPRTAKMRYVGCTMYPKRRHSLRPRHQPYTSAEPVVHMIWEIVQSGEKPELVTLEITTYRNRIKRERAVLDRKFRRKRRFDKHKLPEKECTQETKLGRSEDRIC